VKSWFRTQFYNSFITSYARSWAFILCSSIELRSQHYYRALGPRIILLWQIGRGGCDQDKEVHQKFLGVRRAYQHEKYYSAEINSKGHGPWGPQEDKYFLMVLKSISIGIFQSNHQDAVGSRTFIKPVLKTASPSDFRRYERFCSFRITRGKKALTSGNLANREKI